jgi:hypothetical protein
MKLIKNIILTIILLFLTSSSFAATCDYTPLNAIITELETQNDILLGFNSSYQELLPKCNQLNFSYEELVDKYKELEKEKKYFESKYYNTSLGNMTIGDFIIYMNKIENHYNSINQTFTEQINTVNKIKNWSIGINITLSIALLSLTFVLLRYMRRDIITKISQKISTKIKTKIHNETKIKK